MANSVDEKVQGGVLRTRLFPVLDARIPNVTVMTAPTGFGKTTLLRQWARQRQPNTPLIWVDLAKEPASVSAFWDEVVSAGRHTGGVTGTALKDLQEQISLNGDPTAALSIALQGTETTIVLDGYENLGGLGQSIDQGILDLAGRNPLIKFIISSCSLTALAQPRHQMRGAVQLLGHTDLALNLEDVSRLLAKYLPSAPSTVAGSIYRDTAGFPLAVSAMLMALDSLDRIPADHGVEWRALVAQDLASQFSDPLLIKFLHVTSVTPYFDNALGKKLSKFEDVAGFIDDLERKGFGSWNPYAHNRPVFQYVESIRLMFATEFERAHPKQFLRANSVTAKWFRANADYDRALTFAIRAKNYGLATQIITTLFITSPESYMSDLLAQQLRTIPVKGLRNHPILAFTLGLAYSNNPLMAESATRLLEAAADSLLKPSLDQSPGNRFIVHTMRAVALRQVGRYEESADVAQIALFNLGIVSAETREGMHGYIVLALRHLGCSLFQAGRLEETIPVINWAVAAATSQPAMNYTLSCAAGIHAFMGSTASAQHALDMTEAAAWPRNHDESYLNVLGTAGKAMVLVDASQYAAAEQLLARSEYFCSGTEFWPFTTTALMYARLAMGQGLREAQRLDTLLSPAGRSLGVQNAGIGDNLGTAAMHNMLAILWLSAGQPGRAAAILLGYLPGHHQVAPARMLLQLLTGKAAEAASEYSASVLAHGNNPRTRAALHLLGAVASLRLGSDANALRLLRKAAIVHQATGVRTHLLLVPAEDRGPLLQLAESSGDSEIVEMLSIEVPTSLSNMHLPAELSPREKVVLRQLVHHSSIDEIAGALFVSNNTIKTQLRSIYRKLHAGSRDEAIAKALELELLN